jgi:biotin carboxyl carrier protein
MKYIVEVNGTRHTVDVDGADATIEGVEGSATLAPSTGTPVRVMRIGDRVVRVISRRGETRGVYTLDIDGHVFSADAVDERTRTIRDMTAASTGASGPAPLKAPMPGLIVRVNVAVGDAVNAGQGLVMMEAMKMENELRATSAGTVKAVHAVPGTAVEKGALLIELS